MLTACLPRRSPEIQGEEILNEAETWGDAKQSGRKIILTVLRVVIGCPTNVSHTLSRGGINNYLLKDK